MHHTKTRDNIIGKLVIIILRDFRGSDLVGLRYAEGVEDHDNNYCICTLEITRS